LLFSESGLYFLIFLLLLNIGIWRLSDRDRIELNMSASDRVFMVRMSGWFVMLIGLISLHFSGDLSTYIPFRLGNSAFSSFLILFGLLAQGGIFPFQF
jgi:hypothetical protein